MIKSLFASSFPVRETKPFNDVESCLLQEEICGGGGYTPRPTWIFSKSTCSFLLLTPVWFSFLCRRTLIQQLTCSPTVPGFCFFFTPPSFFCILSSICMIHFCAFLSSTILSLTLICQPLLVGLHRILQLRSTILHSPQKNVCWNGNFRPALYLVFFFFYISISADFRWWNANAYQVFKINIIDILTLLDINISTQCQEL